MNERNSTKVSVLKDEIAYGGFFKIRRIELEHDKFDGSSSGKMVRELFVRAPAVGVLPWDPATDKVLMIRQFLIGAEYAGRPNRPLQVIAGMIDAGESAIDSARRESMEEAGLAVSHLIPAQAFLCSPGGSSERLETFVAVCDLEAAGGYFGLEDEHEDIEAVVMSLDEAVALLDAGEIEAGPAVVALSWLARKAPELRLTLSRGQEPGL